MISKLLKNTKAHFSPMCLAFPIVAATLGIVFMMVVKRPSRMSSFEHYLLFGFLLAVLISVIMRTVYHGLGGLSAVLSFVIIAIVLMMFRFALGIETPSNEFFAKYVKIFVPLLIALAWADVFIP
ncbi:MAG: hypothetical protein ABIF92_03090 [archaeon]